MRIKSNRYLKPRPDLWNRALAVLPGAAVVLGLACGVISLSRYGPVVPPSPLSDEWYAKGNELAAKHDYEKAVAAFQHAARLNPRKPDPYYAIGIIRRDQQDWPQAVSSFQEFVKRTGFGERAGFDWAKGKLRYK